MANTRMKDWFTTHCFRIGLRRAVQCDMPESSGLIHHQDATLCLADAYRLLQNGLKYWLQVAGRAGYDAQHLRAPGLLLQRLGKVLSRVAELVGACFELPLQIANMRCELFYQWGGFTRRSNAHSSLRSGRTKVATARSALRPLARQGHLVGTVTGPLPSGPAKDRGSHSTITAR